MGRLHGFIAIAVPGCSLVVASAMFSEHESACAVRGVWELASVTNNGKEQPLNGARQMKVVTPHHFMWISQEARRDTLPLKTEADTLRRTSVGGGAGTYTATGKSYVEHIEFFNDPSFVGKSWNATCRIDGNRWYHSYAFPQDSTGIPRDSIAHIVEVWRKVE
jgi:hypothetical protein